jgi:nonsense-mediated mRNA decay protein 3
VPPVLSIETCKKCGAIRIPGGWKKVPTHIRGQEDILQFQIWNLLEREVKVSSPEVEIEIEEENRLDRVLKLRLILEGHSHPSLPPHREEYEVEIRRSFATCDTCGMMSGGYHEAILQIRADERQLTEAEEKEISDLVSEMTVSQYESDSKAFVTGVVTDRHGMDFYVGSEHLARTIATELEARYLAEKKENYKLIGQERGRKDKFRVTILIRLPRFRVGDFVEVSGNPCQVISMGRGGVTCFDLETRERFTMNQKSAKWRTLSYLTDGSEKKQFMVVTHAYGKPVQLMNASTYETLEVEEASFDSEIVVGQEVYGLEVENTLYLLPDSSSDA